MDESKMVLPIFKCKECAAEYTIVPFGRDAAKGVSKVDNLHCPFCGENNVSTIEICRAGILVEGQPTLKLRLE